MVTLLNHKSDKELWDKYNVIFKDAWQDLVKAENKLTPKDVELAEKGKDSFSNIQHYLSYIEDLIVINKKYLLLPVDEKPFEIEANSRIIKVPPEFNNCSGVQNDNYAEIITFTIDRYFDYKDLSLANIAVQWKNANNVEGVSFIQLIDLETLASDNQIRFGWPLTEEMTAAAGNLTFAVRFYTSEKDGDGNTIFNYLFNTTPASIPIKPTLNVDWDHIDTVKKLNDFDLFKASVTNSLNPTYAIPTPIEFVDPLPDSEKLVNDIAELTIEAVTNDRNTISCEWYYKPNGYEEITTWPTTRPLYNVYILEGDIYSQYVPIEWPGEQPEAIKSLYKEKGNIKITTNDDYEVSNIFYELYTPKDGEERPEGIVFYVDEGQGAYVEYDGILWPPEGDIYKRLPGTKSTLKIKSSEASIVGDYYVKAINTSVDNVNKSEEVSNPCRFAEPNKPVINSNSNLETAIFLQEDPEIEKFNTLSITLEDNIKGEEYSCIIKKDGEALEDATINIDNNTYSYALTKDAYGTYQFEITANLNRITTPATTSNECVVYAHPIDLKATPVVTCGGDYVTIETTDNTCIFDAINASHVYDLTINLNNITSPGISKELKYEWYVAEADGEYSKILEGGPSGLIASDKVDTNTLSIRPFNVGANIDASNSDQDNLGELHNVYTYKCIITNKILDEATSLEFLFIVK